MAHGTLEAQVEQAAVDLFVAMGWPVANVYHEVIGPTGTLGRETKADVVLEQRLRPALERLNPGLPAEAIALAIESLTRDRSAMTLVQANREVYRLLRSGVKVRIGGAEGEDDDRDVTVRVIDWDNADNNDYFVAQQLWVQGEIYLRRLDLVGFVNGLPLLFVELKGLHQNVEAAYRNNFRDYLDTIPQLFRFNGVVLLSNAFDSRIGSITGAWEHFKEWKRIEREDEISRVSLEVALRGVCDRARLLDLVENFVAFSEQKSGVAKILGQNHQFLGVNNALAAVKKYQLASEPPGVSAEKIAARRRLGVFWHTQGSGKSFSMVFFSQKIFRKLPGNWTFVIVTDREDLDDQIYKTFTACGAVNDKNAQAKSADDLKRLLTEDHRYVFTLIQKFRTDVKGATYKKLSDRNDIIVMADEAHRSQYDTFAMNMRSALPNAAFIGFTGTPLMAGEEKTREVFGDYVSVYNFRQAIEDNATVPLYYEARIPELQLTNEDLADDLTALVEEADLEEDQERKLEREFARQYHLITRDDRLDTIAADLVAHFLGMNFPVAGAPRPATATKAMVVAIDKLTAVRMHDKVRAAWKARLELERTKRDATFAPGERGAHAAIVAFLEETDMAVVVSSSQNEVDAFKKKGLDITTHRQRMVKEDLDTRFKDDRDPLRVVFVCAMWMTGFDVPSCGAIYLDKPMKNHTLMQTIARANRVHEGKVNGLIVDYVGVFRNLQKALAVYGSSSGGGVREGDSPVAAKEAQVDELRRLVDEAKALCTKHGVPFDAIRDATGFQRLQLTKLGVDKLVHPEALKKHYLDAANAVDRVYRALGLDDRKEALSMEWGVIVDLARGIRGLEKPVEIGGVMDAVEKLLDASVDAQAYVIREPTNGSYGGRVDLGTIDFRALERFFKKAKEKASTAAALSSAVKKRVTELVDLNPARRPLHERLTEMIAEYNAGARNVEQFFEDLLAFIKKIEAEEKRAAVEHLTEETLAVYDLLLAIEVTLSPADRNAVRSIAAALPKAIEKKLVIDWRKHQRARAAVKAGIRDALDGLPEAYSAEAFDKAANAVYEHVFESYWGEGKSRYSGA